MKKRYNDFNTYLKNKFGDRVHKITVDANLSCPNRDGTISDQGCIYCNARGSGTGLAQRGIAIVDQVNNTKARVIKRYKAYKYIVYFQSFTNTYGPVSQLKQIYDEAINIEDVVGLSIGTRPDCVSEQVLNVLQAYAKDKMIWLEYGLQSCHDQTLSLINRGHDKSAFTKAVKKTHGRGINICAHVILGLPNETKADMLKTADFIADLGIQGVKLHLLYVIKGTRLAEMYTQGDYICLKKSEFIDILCDFLERLPPDMVIQRLTSDPHHYELVAPKWSLQKRDILDSIHETMDMRSSFQGKMFKKN